MHTWTPQRAYAYCAWRWALKRVPLYLAAALLGAMTYGCVRAAFAFDKPEYQNVPDSVRQWFRSVRSATGVLCCDIADGHATTWRAGPDGAYEVQIDGEWVSVPGTAIVPDAKNPTGDSIVWYVRYQGKLIIRCFVPGGGV